MYMKSYYVITWDFTHDKVKHYDVIPYLYRTYEGERNKPRTREEIKEFVLNTSKYQFWARCEYETIVHSWPTRDNGNEHKMDVYEQIEMNIDCVVDCLIKTIKENL